MTFLLLNQTFYPDVMATGQYLAELAVALVERGHQVTVITSRRAYDHPEKLFPKTEHWRGVRIHRVWSTGFGKEAKWRRAADFATFMAACTLRLLTLGRHDAVVALTSPPLISFLGALLSRLRGSQFFYWVMDFNPDEAIAAGWLDAKSLAARLLDWMSRYSLRHASRIFALDRFMRDRILAKGVRASSVAVLPPWSHDDHVVFDAAGREAFRKQHALGNKFVVMYSGNHSPCHPLDTLLAAAELLKGEPDIVFCFVGGGSEWRKIQEGLNSKFEGASRAGDRSQKSEVSGQWSAANGPMMCLPYQPLEKLSASLSAADIHVVVMGEPFVGLVHPCKIYNILSVAAPVLYIGPQPSHVTELMAGNGCGDAAARLAASQGKAGGNSCAFGAFNHGDAAGVARFIREVQAREKVRSASRQVCSESQQEFSKQRLLPRMVRELEGNGSMKDQGPGTVDGGRWTVDGPLTKDQRPREINR